MSTDRELLEKAANAAGKEHAWLHRGQIWLCWSGEPHKSLDKPWNPLTDDGDALRLAVKLRICTFFEAADEDVEWVVAEIDGCGYNESFPGDENAATRRAIVRAAAAMAGEP